MPRRNSGVDGDATDGRDVSRDVNNQDVDGMTRAASRGGTSMENSQDPRTSRTPRAPVGVLSPDSVGTGAGSRSGSGSGSGPGREDGRHRPGPPPPPAPPVVPEGSGPRRRRPRKLAAFLLLTIASALVLVAVGVGGYPFYTDFQAARHQRALKSQLDQAAKDGADRAKLLEQYKNRTFAVGSPVTRILIPKLGVETVVVEGTSDEALAAGAGHYPQSPLPGDAGNVAIAGHRTMNGHPFGDLDKLVPGDQVILQTPFATYNYKIVPGFDGHANPWVTSPEDWTVISVTTQSHLLTLTTCNPKGQASQRLVARAEMVSSQPVT